MMSIPSPKWSVHAVSWSVHNQGLKQVAAALTAGESV